LRGVRKWRIFSKNLQGVVHMASRNRLLKALSAILPGGLAGASVLLALAATDATAASNNTNTASDESVSARLQAIRSGVSDMTGSATDPAQNDAAAAPAWWGNGGFGRWGIGWHNGGWGNGGWHNGGWGNGGWHNGGWGNGGWHNAGWGNGGWGNGWHNFWHNW
jgi:rSAM-associated Gly-rich repeat protein